MNIIRYHVCLKSNRTTVSLDKILSDMLSLKLETKPGTKEAHTAVRKQIEQFIEHDRGRGGQGLTKYIMEQAILLISDKMLSKQYEDYQMEEFDKNYKREL